MDISMSAITADEYRYSNPKMIILYNCTCLPTCMHVYCDHLLTFEKLIVWIGLYGLTPMIVQVINLHVYTVYVCS